MTIEKIYARYAEDFEKTFIDDDWTRLERYFSEDAIYEVGGEAFEGRKSVFGKIKQDFDTLDRRMGSRSVELGQREHDGSKLAVSYCGTFTRPGCRDLTMSGWEIVTFEDDRIVRLVEDLDPASRRERSSWMAENGRKLYDEPAT